MEDYRLEQSGQEVQDILNGAAMQVDLTAETERATEAEQTLDGKIDTEKGRIDALEEKIPSGASSSNKLATEEYVDDSVATATATFRGTFNLVSDLSLTVDATEQQIATALAGAISTADNNDYSFVQIPTSDETPTEIAEIDRYKFNGTAWAFEYALNNSGFTAAEWAAINSGITSELVTKLGNLPTAAALSEALASKQNVLTFDDVPTPSSNNPVKSGGVYSAIDDEKGARLNADTALQQAIEAILLLIPTAASSLNQLADKAFVNSSIATNTATFRGTFNLVNDLHLTLAATHAEIGTALASAISDEDNNDYCFVQIPTSATSPTEIAQTDRYKYNGTTWEYEYTLNNSVFTSAQWTAINSGITSALVSKLSALPTNSELTTDLGTLSAAITTINQKIPASAAQNNKLVDTAALEAYIIQVLDVLTVSYNVTSSDGHVTFHIAQTDGKITAVTLTTNDIASASDLTILAGRVTTTENDIDSLEFRVGTNEANIALLQAAYGALTQSDPEIIQPTDTWPVANPALNVIYRVIDRVNTPPENYSDYMWNGTTMVLMATYNNAIDPRPKKGSTNLVESGGVFDNMGALDISELNATENPHTLATYADLSAALAAIPSNDYKKGGMSIKFVQTYDNKYVQYRLMSDTFNTTLANWQGVDDEPTAGSENLVNSNGASKLKVNLKTTDLTPSSTHSLNGYKLLTTGSIAADANCSIDVIPLGDASLLLLEISKDSDVTYQFQNAPNATSVNPNPYLIGTPKTSEAIGTVEVPASATWILVCRNTSNTSNKVQKCYNDVDETPTHNSKNLITSDAVFGATDVKLPSKWYYDIYTSKTLNLLDVENVLFGYEFDANNNLVKSQYQTRVVSRPIYVGDLRGKQITISGYPNQGFRIYLYKSLNFTAEDYVTYWTLTNTERTITMDAVAMFAVVILSASTSVTNNYSTMKVSIGDTPSQDAFQPYYLGNKETFGGLKVVSKWYYDIYTSTTTNLLDVNNVLRGYKFDSYNLVKSDRITHVVSRPIYVGGLQGEKLTISGYSADASLQILFYSSDEFVAENNLGAYNLSNTSRTLNIPDNAVFAILSLSVYNSNTYNYSNMRVGAGTSAISSSVSFVPKYIGIAKQWKLFGKTIMTEEDSDYKLTKEYERNRVNSLFIPYSISPDGIPYDSDHQFYKGDYTIYSNGRFRALQDCINVNPAYGEDREDNWVLDREGINLLFFTDSHINKPNASNSKQNLIDTIDFVNKAGVKIDAILHAGDIVTTQGHNPQQDMLNLHAEFFNEVKKTNVPFIFSIGNHDNNDWDNTPVNPSYHAFNDEDWGNIWFNYAETKYGIVRQTRANGYKSRYHYFDIPDKRLRIISVDVQDIDNCYATSPVDASGNCVYNGGNCWHISQEQMTWLANTALNITENGWTVIIVSHQTVDANPYVSSVDNPLAPYGEWYTFDGARYDAGYNSSAIRKFYDMCVAFNTQGTYVQEASTYADDTFYNMSAMSVDFGTRFNNLVEKPAIVCWLFGHEHVDRNFTVDGINFISTLNASANNSVYIKVQRILNTNTQNGFDLISINPSTKKLRMFRYGAGKDCNGDGGDRFLPNGLSY